jgi:osmotically-inducible protein OsmY
VEKTKLQQAVRDELAQEPRVDHTEVAVSADDYGVVTLRGTVGSPRQRREAGRAAKRVFGVQEVRNNLDVRVLIGDRREDAVLRADVLQALTLNSLVPSGIDAKVDGAVVTLTGTAHWNFEREEAEATAGNVRGVRGIRSEIVLIPTAHPVEVKDAIEQRLNRNAAVDADSVSVESLGGKVILRGAVSSWSAREAAVEAAWSVPNVTEVEDRIDITIRYPAGLNAREEH